MRSGTLINGNPDCTVTAVDRGFLYGDGLFETVAVVGGDLPLWPRHWKRLESGARRLGLPPPSETAFRGDLERLLPLADGDNAVLRLQYTAGSGGRGLQRPATVTPTRVASLLPYPRRPEVYWESGVRLHVCATRIAEQPALAGIKHCNRLEYVLARGEWSDEHIPEGLLLDTQNKVCEGTISNVFAVRQGALLTPSLDRCGVHGVMRAIVLEQASEWGMTVEQGRYTLDDWLAADELFLTNSLIGIWPVRVLLDQHWQVGPITRRLQQAIGTAGLAPIPDRAMNKV